MELNSREQNNRNLLSIRKPLAYAKIQKHPQMIREKKCVALIQLQYDYRCNFRCKHCAIEEFRANAKDRKMTVEDVKRIADQADAMGLASICISGGEPLIFPELDKIIKAIGSDRFNISMDTNGWFLSEDKIKWLVDMGVDRIHLSMDGLAENHAEFRGIDGSWDKCIAALPFCRKYGLGVIVNIVATKSLIKSKELLKQLEYLKIYGEHASIIYAKPVGTFADSEDEILDTKDLAHIQSLTERYNCSTHLSMNCGHVFGCLCFKRHFSITAYGDVLPCPWIPISMGNIFEEDLNTIVRRGLDNKWFSYDYKYTCQSGNRDSDFFKTIIPQIENFKEYPVDWREIKW